MSVLYSGGIVFHKASVLTCQCVRNYKESTFSVMFCSFHAELPHLPSLDLTCMALGVKVTWQHLPSLHPSISHLARNARTPSPWVHSHIGVSPGPAVNSQYMLLQPSAITQLSRHRHRQGQSVTELCSSPRSSNSSCWLQRRKHPTLSQPHRFLKIKIKV